LQTKEEFRDFAREVKIPLLANMTEFGKGPLLSVKQLADMGYRMVIFPQTLFRVASHAATACLGDLMQSGTQTAWLDRMQPRAELYKVLNYDPAQDDWPLAPGGSK
jgi:methylisocitrate lyase